MAEKGCLKYAIGIILSACLDSETKRVAIEALEKQIPKMPEPVIVDASVNASITTCPTCGNELMPNGEAYCSDCGQKIDWGVEG